MQQCTLRSRQHQRMEDDHVPNDNQWQQNNVQQEQDRPPILDETQRQQTQREIHARRTMIDETCRQVNQLPNDDVSGRNSLLIQLETQHTEVYRLHNQLVP